MVHEYEVAAETIEDALFEALTSGRQEDLDALYRLVAKYRERYPASVKRLSGLGRRLFEAIESAGRYQAAHK